MISEPMWKLTLNWGVVITFLSLPLVLMSIQLFLLSHPSVIVNAEHYRDHFKYLVEFQRNLALLVFGLAGLEKFRK
jgi:hypothetical protein